MGLFNGPWLNKEEHERSIHLNLIGQVNMLNLHNYELQAKLELANSRIAELEAALKPFAEITQQQNFKDYQYNQDDCVMTAGVWGFKPDFTFKLGDLRQARKALEGK